MSERYAANTTVDAGTSRMEIERTLVRYGAEAFSYGWDKGQAAIQFVKGDRTIRFVLPMPDRSSREFTHTEAKGIKRSAEAAQKEWEKASRQRWRALALMVKAKLEGVEAGIVTFEEEFMPHVVLPGGKTVFETISEDIDKALSTGQTLYQAIES